jgi:hypothetical protein
MPAIYLTDVAHAAAAIKRAIEQDRLRRQCPAP